MSGRIEILFGLLARSSQTGVMLAAAALVAWRMPVVEQGFYWAFLSLGALVPIGEFGLTPVVLQTASHYAARGDTDGLHRFWRSARRFAGAVVPVASAAVLGLGWILFASSAQPGTAPAWHWPWTLYVLLLAAAQLLSPALGYIEGAVSAADSWRFQARLEIASGAVLLAALALGAGLWSVTLYGLARFAAFAALTLARRAQFPPVRGDGIGAGAWKHEILPYQWKLAVSAVTGFLIFRAFTPVVLAQMGPEAAARFGLTLAVMGSWLAITVAWPASQTARIGQLASRQDRRELRAAFRGMLGGSSLFAAAGALLILAALQALEALGIPYGARSAGYAATALLLGAAVLQHVVLCASILLRSERRDPLLPYSVSGSLITVCALWYAAGAGGLVHVALAYFLCSCLGFAMGMHAFRANIADWRYYLRPHRASP